MNTQFLEYVRQQLMVATADFSGATKGQLMAWLENAQFDTGTFKRKKPRVWDKENEKWETLDNPPIPGKQSHAKGSHIPLVQPVEFATASWRRALLSLEEHQKAWLLWNWLAAQDVKAELGGKDTYQYCDLAALVGIKPDNWSKNYGDYWRAMCGIFASMDSEALMLVVRTRSQQKAAFSQQGIAKVN